MARKESALGRTAKNFHSLRSRNRSNTRCVVLLRISAILLLQHVLLTRQLWRLGFRAGRPRFYGCRSLFRRGRSGDQSRRGQLQAGVDEVLLVLREAQLFAPVFG